MVAPKQPAWVNPKKIIFSDVQQGSMGQKYVQVKQVTESGNQTVVILTPPLRIIACPTENSQTGSVRLVFESELAGPDVDPVIEKQHDEFLGCVERLEESLTLVAQDRSLRWFGKKLTLAEVRKRQELSFGELAENDGASKKQVHLQAKIIENEPSGKGLEEILRNAGPHGDSEHSYYCVLQLAGVYFRGNRFGYSWYLRGTKPKALPHTIPCLVMKDSEGRVKTEPTGYLYKKEEEERREHARRLARDRSLSAASEIESLDAPGYDSRSTSTLQSTIGSSSTRSTTGPPNLALALSLDPIAEKKLKAAELDASSLDNTGGEPTLALALALRGERGVPPVTESLRNAGEGSIYHSFGASIDTQVAYLRFVASQEAFMASQVGSNDGPVVDATVPPSVHPGESISLEALAAAFAGVKAPSGAPTRPPPHGGMESPIDAPPAAAAPAALPPKLTLVDVGSNAQATSDVKSPEVKHAMASSFGAADSKASTISFADSTVVVKGPGSAGSGSGSGGAGSKGSSKNSSGSGSGGPASGPSSGAASGEERHPQSYRTEDVEEADDAAFVANHYAFGVMGRKHRELVDAYQRELDEYDPEKDPRVVYAKPDPTLSLGLDLEDDGIALFNETIGTKKISEVVMGYLRYIRDMVASATDDELTKLLRYALSQNAAGLVVELIQQMKATLNKDNILKTALLAIELKQPELQEACERYMLRPDKLSMVVSSAEFAERMTGDERPKLITFLSAVGMRVSKELKETREKADQLDEILKKHPHLTPQKRPTGPAWKMELAAYAAEQ